MTGRWARRVLDAELSRRAFLKAAGAAAAIAAAGTLGCAGPQPSSAASRQIGAQVPHSGRLAVAADADPATAVDRALDTFGGLSDIVKRGDKVLVKGNWSFARTVDQAACNHPDVLVRTMQRLRDAGAAEVTAVDHTIEPGSPCLDTSGIKAAVEKAGFRAINLNEEGDYAELSFKCGDLGSVRVMRRLMDADVFIDAPVIKSHGTTRMTASLKNLMGVVYDRQALHSSALDRCIADLGKALPPDLVIADAFRVLKTGGPGGGGAHDVITTPHEVIVGDDMVAVDAYAATLLGLRPGYVEHLQAAYDEGVGEIDTGKLSFVRA